jgi:DNA repair protein RecO (recombination protein O)
MSVERATGLVLRVRPLTETSLIVHWLTAVQGRLATVAKGARRPKSPFRSKLDLFFEADFSFQRSRRSDLHTLREVVLRETHPALRTDLGRLRRAAYAALLVEKATEAETPVSAVYALLRDFLSLDPVPGGQSVLSFELKLLAESGLAPDLAASRLSAGARQAAQFLTDVPLATCTQVALTPGQLRELSRFLHGFLVYHFGSVPAGRQAALGLERGPSLGLPNTVGRPAAGA